MTFNDAQRAAILEKWPHLTPGQLAALAEKSIALTSADTLAVTSPADCVYFLTWSIVGKDPSLIREAPTAQQFVANMEAQRRAQDLEVRAEHRMSWQRAAEGMSADQLLEAVPAGSAALKASVESPADKATTISANKKPAAPLTRADWLQVAAEENGYSDARAYIRAVGPTKARGVAEHLQAAHARPKLDERSATERASAPLPGKAAADRWAATPEAQRLPPAQRVARYRELCAQEA